VDNIEFSEWAKDVDQLFSPVSQKKGISFNISVSEDLGDVFTSDIKRLNQIIKNLLSNALKFTEKGSVELCVGKVSNDVKLSACTTHCGSTDSFLSDGYGFGYCRRKTKFNI